MDVTPTAIVSEVFVQMLPAILQTKASDMVDGMGGWNREKTSNPSENACLGRRIWEDGKRADGKELNLPHKIK